MKTFLAIVGIILAVILFAVIVGAIEAAIFMLLWNYVLCALFPVIPLLTFWKAWGLLILINIVLGACRSVVNVNKN
jgi:hypothetical protein